MDLFGKSIGLKQYDGLSDPREFEKLFKLQATMFNWDEQKQTAILPLVLKGKAERIYDALDNTKKADGKEILKAVIAGCTVTQDVLLDSFYTRKPGQGELLSHFALDLQDLLSKALPNLKDPEKSILLRKQLSSFLPEHMRALIHFNQSKSWDELLIALDQSMPHVVAHSNTAMAYPNYQNPGPFYDQTIKSEPVEANSIGNRVKFDGICHYCKKPGHRIADCYKRSQTNQRGLDKQGYEYKPRDGEKKKYSKTSGANIRFNNQKSSNTVELNESSGSEDERWAERAEANILDVQNPILLDLTTISASTALLKRSVGVSFKGFSQPHKVKALFDGGATSSFLRLSSLPTCVQKEIHGFKNGSNGQWNDFKKETLLIRGATGTVSDICIIGKVNLKISEWRGSHSFVITDKICGKDMILGRDFLKENKVVIDHGNDVITIEKSSGLVNSPTSTDPVCYVVEAVKVEKNSEKFIKCHTDLIETGREVLLKPKALEEGVYLAHSTSKIDENGNFFVSFLNTTNEEYIISKGSTVGTITEEFEIVKDSESVELKTIDLDAGVEAGLVPTEIAHKKKLNAINLGKNLSIEQKEMLSQLIYMKREAFQLHENDVGLTDLIEHEIDTGSCKPIRQKQFRLPQAVHGELERQLEELSRNKLIEPSISPWRNPMLITKQTSRDGKVKYRFITDMRQVNEATVKDSFPLPRIDETLDSLGGSAYFAVIDMARGYFQVPLKKEDREKTAFTANNKLYQWCVMPLGSANAPSTFSRLMDLVLKGLTYVYCLVYLDDTIIYSKNFEDHLVHCREILDRIIKAKLKLRPEKCTFGTDEVGYLGFIVTTKGIRPDEDKVKAIDALQFPKTARKMIGFLGAVNFYRDFIKGFSNTASVLYKMSQSNKKI